MKKLNGGYYIYYLRVKIQFSPVYMRVYNSSFSNSIKELSSYSIIYLSQKNNKNNQINHF